MKSPLPRASRQFLEQLGRELSFLSREERAQVLAATRKEIRALPGRGRRAEDLAGAFGSPAILAMKFKRTEREELPVRSGREFLLRLLAWPTVGFAVVTALAMFSLERFGASAGELGFAALWVPPVQLGLLPVVLALVPLVLSGWTAVALQLLGVLGLGLVVVLGGPEAGWFYLPVWLLLGTQILVPQLLMRGSMGRPDGPWRPLALLGLIAVVTSVVIERGWVHIVEQWWTMTACVAMIITGLGVLFRRRWLDILTIACGIAILSAVLATPWAGLATGVDAGLWLVGGVGFVIGHLALAGDLWHRRAAQLLASL
ncbi:hypothetical protein GCM10027417_22990 [Glutamicibacter endophyticus]